VDLGIGIGGDLRHLGSLARQVEDAGFESVWVAETARSAYVQAAVACAATARITVGSNIALAFPRSPTVTAMAARDLAELSGGRFVLGLGTQVKRVIEQRYGVPFEHPAPKVAEVIQAVRAVFGAFGGRPPGHEGRFYRITMPPFPGAEPPAARIPIYLAAVNEKMAQTAGRCADGVLGHPMTSPAWVRDVLRPAVERGAREAGRDPAEVSISTGVILQVSPDRDTASREAALQLAFYATTRTYRPVLAMHGFDDRLEPLRRAFVQKDFARMTDIALPMVGALAIAGPSEECRDRIAAFEGVADRVILSGAWVGPTGEGLIENHQAILEAFAPGRWART
jgi:probable F420-dependent oxidoreductase